MGAEHHSMAKHADQTLLPPEMHPSASARPHSVPRQAGTQNRPPCHTLGQFRTLILHLAGSHPQHVYPHLRHRHVPLFATLAGNRVEGKGLHMADFLGGCSGSRSPVPPPTPGRLVGIFNTDVFSASAERRMSLQSHCCSPIPAPIPQAGSYSLCQICHLLHSFHSPRERVQLHEEVLGFPDADGFLL